MRRWDGNGSEGAGFVSLIKRIPIRKNRLTGSARLSNIAFSDRVAETCEACDRGRTCGVSSFFIIRGLSICKRFF